MKQKSKKTDNLIKERRKIIRKLKITDIMYSKTRIIFKRE